MTDVAGLPDGTYVEWRGRTYRGALVFDPPRSVVIWSDRAEDESFTPGRTGGFERVVPDSEVTMFGLTTTCRWRGARFQVLNREPDGRLNLLYLDGSDPEALGLVRQSRELAGIVLPDSEVSDLVQTRTEIDLTRRKR